MLDFIAVGSQKNTLSDSLMGSRHRGHSSSPSQHCCTVRCRVLVAVWCSALQCGVVRCSVLQCVAVCCSVLQYVAGGILSALHRTIVQCVAGC